ncbi:hypothetical protein [Christiangramia forsetii]|uniref:Uncharacterized protein n=2 Tax=Christiangramia forsetii TaxID=411153 RepID=A0M4I9_CHRFK|nr:hypothetical protein [Christiangramia forsetii]GGG23331.1 hypothetical protein GCM10011532_03080 [Christiangramia forsetii]CAL67534.1 hypothetical protein GFO_2578 [Christiangramia forsetii KT0803]
MNKIINLNGNAVELAQVKSISVNEYFDVEPKTNQLKIEFKGRKEYIFNPGIKEWELNTFNDVLLVDYPDGQTAIENYLQIMEIWEEALQKE